MRNPFRRRRDRDEDRAFAEHSALVADLRAHGLPVTSIAELVNSDLDYKAQVPVLVDRLPRLEHMGTREMVVRSLTVPWARPATACLVEEFRDLTKPVLYRWTVGNALAALADPSMTDVLIDLAIDQRYGMARQMVVAALPRTRDTRVVAPLVRLLDDPDVAGHAVSALADMRTPEAVPHLQRFVDHDKEWIRTAARRGLARLGA